jgi:hypothetical protein
MLHELFTIQNNRLDLRSLGAKARSLLPRVWARLTLRPSDLEGEPGGRAVGGAGCIFQISDVQQLWYVFCDQRPGL